MFQELSYGYDLLRQRDLRDQAEDSFLGKNNY